MFTTLSILIPLLPIVGFGVIGLLVSPKSTKLAHSISIGLVSASLIIAAGSGLAYLQSPESDKALPLLAYNLEWITFSSGILAEPLVGHFGILLDPISIVLSLLVCSVSFFAQVYSIGYMDGHPGYRRFYAYMSLFTGAMLGLVLSSNILQTYIFWELVGLGSFLLISYYFEKPSAVSAAKKAFIVTRFADLGFLIGLLILSFHAHSFDYSVLLAQAPLMPAGVVALACALVAMGAFGKSAMFPLHIWLPDAMEGPTPVSALIHAATMVVAGVYLIARLMGVYLYAPYVLYGIAIIGAGTSLFAAVIACTQFDIKRVLAFSTLSQIGYMMLALGSTTKEFPLGYTASMFHMSTHAFFKALLFLCAGAVIHAVHTNDIRQMGGLRKKMPITHLAFLIGTLAITALPPYLVSGFYSKDEMLLALQISGHPILLSMASFVAMLTAFYMFRLYFLTFWHRVPSPNSHAHDPSSPMLFSLLILSLLSIVSGWLPFGESIFLPGTEAFHGHPSALLIIGATALSLLGSLTAYTFYKRKTDYPEKVYAALGAFARAAKDKFYIDEAYIYVTKQIIFRRFSQPLERFDRNVVDGAVDSIGSATRFGSAKTILATTGMSQVNVFTFALGLIAIIGFLLVSTR